MIKGTGNCRITGVELGELHVDFLAPQVLPTVKYAYVDADKGQRFGFNHRNSWSEATVEILRQLKEAMEKEICAAIFEGTEEVSEKPPESDVPQL